MHYFKLSSKISRRGSIWLAACASIVVALVSASPTRAEPDPATAPNQVTSIAGEDAANDVPQNVQQVFPPPDGQIPNIDPVALYGGDIVFDVYRKKAKVGEHRVSFERNGDRLTVSVHFNLAVNFLFFKAYSFEYESTEIWQNGSLIAVTSTVDDNGKIANVVATGEGDLFKLDGPRGSTLASSWVFPTNHWHRGQINSRTLINTITGRLIHVEPIRKGIDRIDTAQGPVNAEHFIYTGELRDTDVWYDQEGRWVKMAFKAKDGSIIDYRCRQCGLGQDADNRVTATDVPALTSDVAEATTP